MKLALDMKVGRSEGAPVLSCERQSGGVFAPCPSSIPRGLTCPRESREEGPVEQLWSQALLGPARSPDPQLISGLVSKKR